jgi:hypothetical protein
MDSDLDALARMLEETEVLLRKHRIIHWAEWLKKDATLIRGRDFYGVAHLLSAFGGMGSLNDLGLAEPSKDNPKVLDTSADDAQFQSLLNNIHSLATKLATEHEQRNAEPGA